MKFKSFPCFISDVLNLYEGLNRKPSQAFIATKACTE